MLESNYNQDREQIALIIEQLLQIGQLEVMEPEVVWHALTDYKDSNAESVTFQLIRSHSTSIQLSCLGDYIFGMDVFLFVLIQNWVLHTMLTDCSRLELSLNSC